MTIIYSDFIHNRIPLSYRQPALLKGCTTWGSPNHSVSVAQTPLSSPESVNSFGILSQDTELDSLDSGSVTERGNLPGSPHTATNVAAGIRHVMLKVLKKRSVT